MKGLKSLMVLLALLASLLGGSLAERFSPQISSVLPALHQPALYQYLASGGSSSGGDPGNN